MNITTWPQALCEIGQDKIALQIVDYFRRSPHAVLSTEELAMTLGIDVSETRRAVHMLHVRNILNYCPWFGSSDLCHLQPQVREQLFGSFESRTGG